MVSPADVPDADGAYTLLPLAKAVAPTLTLVRADGAYAGDLADWATAEHGLTVEVVQTPAGQRGFVPQAMRWVVERTWAWLGRHRRLSRDVEQYDTTSEALSTTAGYIR